MAQLYVVLVEPQIPANIGMVCRAMANFGVSRLRLVNPCNHLDDMARRLAVGAAPLLEEAEVFDSLEAALADLTASIAATRRSGRFRGELLELAAYAPRLEQLHADARLGLVFGREDSGLTLEEVGLCQQAVTIRTTESLGSLNLAQAVLLFLYELTRTPSPAPPYRPTPSLGEQEQLCHDVAALLDRIAFLNPQRPDAILHPLRRLLTRADPDCAEFNLLRGMFAQLDASAKDWPAKRRGGGA